MIYARALLGLVSIVLLNSCSTTPSRASKTPPSVASATARKELAQAQVDIAAGADRRAVGRLRNVMAKFPKTDVADDATLLLAGIFYRQNQAESAYKTYMSLVESNVLSPNEAEAILGAGKSLHKLGRMDEALSLNARGLKIPGLTDPKKVDFYRHRYALLSAMGDRLDALEALAFIYDHDPKPDVKANAQARANEIVNLQLNESDLGKIVGDSRYGFVRAAAAFRLGTFRLKQKDYDGARSDFNQAAQNAKGTPLETQAAAYLTQIDSRRHVEPMMIGTVLPLSGKYAPMAEKTLHGLQLGLGIYGPDHGDFKLAVMDSEGTPEGARKAVERLVSENNVIAVVGSLLSKTAAAVATKTEELGVPSIALSQKSGLTESGAFTFRNAVTSEMQVKELVRVAMDELGLKRFALMYPNEPYGVEYANLFWDEVLARGGQVNGAQPYGGNETDFRGPIKRLVGTYYLEDRKAEYQTRVRDWFKKQKHLRTRNTPPDDLLPPIVDFDAIFMPDSPRAVGQAAPMLAYQGVNKVRLLGTNVWNTPELSRRGQRNVEGAVFVDTNFTNEPRFKGSKFYRDYTKIFGEEPGLFETQGFEAGVLLRQLITGGEKTRVGLAQALTQLRSFEGVAGPMVMNAQHELVRPLATFTVKSGEIVTK